MICIKSSCRNIKIVICYKIQIKYSDITKLQLFWWDEHIEIIVYRTTDRQTVYVVSNGRCQRYTSTFVPLVFVEPDRFTDSMSTLCYPNCESGSSLFPCAGNSTMQRVLLIYSKRNKYSLSALYWNTSLWCTILCV